WPRRDTLSVIGGSGSASWRGCRRDAEPARVLLRAAALGLARQPVAADDCVDEPRPLGNADLGRRPFLGLAEIAAGAGAEVELRLLQRTVRAERRERDLDERLRRRGIRAGAERGDELAAV